MRLYVEHLPLMMHLGIVLELRACLSMLDAVFDTSRIQMLHYYTIQPGLLKLRSYSNKKEVQGVIFHKRLKYACPSEREESAPALLHCLRY